MAITIYAAGRRPTRARQARLAAEFVLGEALDPLADAAGATPLTMVAPRRPAAPSSPPGNGAAAATLPQVAASGTTLPK